MSQMFTRRQALQSLSAAALGAAVLPATPRRAEAAKADPKVEQAIGQLAAVLWNLKRCPVITRTMIRSSPSPCVRRSSKCSAGSNDW